MKILDKLEFDGLVYVPELEIDTREFNYDYHYEQNDLIEIFNNRIQRQLYDQEHEQYVDCSYISICNAFPNSKPDGSCFWKRQVWRRIPSLATLIPDTVTISSLLSGITSI